MVLSVSLVLLHLGSKLPFSRCPDRFFSGAPPKDNMRLHVFFIFIWLYVEDFRTRAFGESCSSRLFSEVGYPDPYLDPWFLCFSAVQGQAL